jgi:hypothetical protein
VRQELGIERVEIARAEPLQQDTAAVPRRQGGVALIAPHRGRRQVAALAVVRQPCAQVTGEIMSVRIADAAAFDLAHLSSVGGRKLAGREVSRAVLRAAIRPRHAIAALPARCPVTGCDLAKRRHGAISGCCWRRRGMNCRSGGRWRSAR